MTIRLISMKKSFAVVNRLQRSKPEKSRNIKDNLNYLSEKKIYFTIPPYCHFLTYRALNIWK